MNIRHFLIGITLLLACSQATAQASKDSDGSTGMDYRRSSLYSVMINHTDQKFATDIRNAFMEMKTPDKYNDHDLSVKVLNLDSKLKKAGSENENQDISDFLVKNNIASRLIGKWFDRDYYTGACDMELIKERGLYNASEFDKEIAARSARAEALLMDAGEDLIGNTFVLVNDIRYIDKSKGSKALGTGLRILGGVAAALTGSNIDDLTDNLADMAESYKGFKCKINTFLYQLVWDEESAATFYRECYSGEPSDAKRDAFEMARPKFKLRYAGKVESSGSNTSFLGINEDQPQVMVLKACQRAIDENIASLQSEVEAFRTKVPLETTEPLTAFVGMKEGVNKSSRFEVLEVQEDAQGKRSYERVGIIAPQPNLIWDNRFMAEEEGAENATLGKTTFKKVSGGDFFPGMLIREIKGK